MMYIFLVAFDVPTITVGYVDRHNKIQCDTSDSSWVVGTFV